MKKLKVKTKLYPYTIYIGKNIANSLNRYVKEQKLGNYGIVLTNKTIYSVYIKKIPQIFKKNKSIQYKFIILPDTEKIKSFSSVQKICKEIGKLDFKKQVFFICWGGGVIGDLGGFIASIYKRGAPYIQLPTSLLSHIDSSIGGKTAIDLPQGKNLLGSFWQPKLVISDISFIKTLKLPQIKEGLAEAIKSGLIKDKGLFEFIEKDHSDILRKEGKKLTKLIYWCAKIKKEVVEQDEREEKGIRTILNFGHTIGHGIEASKNYRLSHGKSVSLGMIAALHIAEVSEITKNKNIKARTINLLKNIGLPVKTHLKAHKILTAIKKDKKFIRGKTRMVFIKEIGKATVKEEITSAQIREGIKFITF